MGKEPVDVGAVVLQARLLATCGEAHVAIIPGDIELAQEAGEAWIGVLVEDDEARIDGVGSRGGLDVNGVCVPADPIGRLEHGDLVVGV